MSCSPGNDEEFLRCIGMETYRYAHLWEISAKWGRDSKTAIYCIGWRASDDIVKAAVCATDTYFRKLGKEAEIRRGAEAIKESKA